MTISAEDARVLRDLFARERIAPAPGEAMLDSYGRIAEWIVARRAVFGQPMLAGICGAQGSGKSTLALGLRALIENRTSLRVAALSIDDFYLARAARLALAQTVHPLFATRGPPGTHDIDLAELTISRLLTAQPGTSTALPRFDKATDDTVPASAWPAFRGRADIVLLEGWCVGATAQHSTALDQPVNALERDEDADGVLRRSANAALAGPYRALFDRLDLLLLIAAPSFDSVFAWRREQEAKLPTRSMDDNSLRRFIDHYERLTRHILRDMPARADGVMTLGDDRAVASLVLR